MLGEIKTVIVSHIAKCAKSVLWETRSNSQLICQVHPPFLRDVKLLFAVAEFQLLQFSDACLIV